MSDETTPAPEAASTVLTVAPNGPIEVAGDFTLKGRDGEVLVPGRNKAYLCRCGQSSNKPFCDGAHSKNAFSDEAVAAQA